MKLKRENRCQMNFSSMDIEIIFNARRCEFEYVEAHYFFLFKGYVVICMTIQM